MLLFISAHRNCGVPTLAGPKAKTQASDPETTECRTSPKLARHTAP